MIDIDHLEELQKKTLKEKISDKMSKKEMEYISLSKEDEMIFNYIRRKGVYKEYPSYVYQNNKFYTVIRVHSYNEELQDLWLSNFAFMENLTIELDIDQENVEIVKSAINRQIEIEDFQMQRGRSYSSIKDAYDNQQESKALYNQIKSGKGLNKISLNFIISGHTKEDLMERLKILKETMKKSDIEGSIFINSVAEDLKISKFKNSTATISPTNALRTFFPFNFQEMIDATGTYIGRSKNQGQIVIDHTLKTSVDNRNSNDILLTGKTGNGKSALVKNIFKKEFLQGHQSIILDPENEYAQLCSYLGGQNVDVSKNMLINPLEYNTEYDVDSKHTKGWAEHISSLKTFFQIIDKNLEGIPMGYLEKWITAFYTSYFKNKGETLKEYEGDHMEIAIQSNFIKNYDTSLLSAQDFPSFEDLSIFIIEYIKHKKNDKSNLKDEEFNAFTKIEHALTTITETYSSYFVGKSNFDFFDAQMIVFNFKPIEEASENIKNALIHNILSVFCNAKIIDNKKYNKINNTTRKLRIGIDEAHTNLNSNNVFFVKWYLNAIKRFRKYDACSLISSQSTLDFKPININSEIAEDLLKIYNEVLYKYFFFQELPLEGAEYENISSLLTKDDINLINRNKRGDFLLKLPTRKIAGHHMIDKFESTVLYHT